MRTVAIVEDSRREAELLKTYFSKYSAEKAVQFKLTHFASGNLLLDNYKPVYDMVLLDIGLPGLDGMETAAELRKLDRTTMIIFVTNMARFAVRGYEVGAFDFIVKPVTYSNFALKLQRALSKIGSSRDREVVVSTADGIFRLALSQIKYVEISGHKIAYHTTDGTIPAYGNLKEVEASLDSRMFARCNSCYLVNLNHVQAVRGHQVVVDGETLQISRPKRKQFVQMLNDYLGGGIA